MGGRVVFVPALCGEADHGDKLAQLVAAAGGLGVGTRGLTGTFFFFENWVDRDIGRLRGFNFCAQFLGEEGRRGVVGDGGPAARESLIPGQRRGLELEVEVWVIGWRESKRGG